MIMFAVIINFVSHICLSTRVKRSRAWDPAEQAGRTLLISAYLSRLVEVNKLK